MDVKTSFLNGELDTEIFMFQPEGYTDSDRPDYVCKLKKSLYGLKQSARCWNRTLDLYLKSIGYSQCKSDGCLYYKCITDENCAICKSQTIVPIVPIVLL